MRRLAITPWGIILPLFVVVHIVAAFVLSVGLVSSVAIIEAAIFSWAGILLYARVRWWATAAGRQVMSLLVFLALLTTVSVLPTNSPGWLLRWVACGVLIAMATIVLNLLRLIWKAQRR